jgi:FecR-like protein
MQAIGRISGCLRTLAAVVAVAFAAQAHAQERAGVVTTLEGDVTVTRASLPRPAPLKFKDDIYARDRVATGKESVARILLGGRAVVTVREHSTVTITEAPGVATVDLAAGRVAVAVAREKMRAGDVVEVRTPNAVAGIRGTVIVAEVFGADDSVITVLKGSIDVSRLDGGRLVGAATIVSALQRVTIAGGAPLAAPRPVSPAAAEQLGQEFRLAPPRVTPSAATAAVNAGELTRAAKDLAIAAPRRAAVDRRLLPNTSDDDQDDVTLERRGMPGRERLDNPGKVDPPTRSDASAAVKSYGRADAVNALGEATKGSDRGGRRNRDRDRY